MLQITLAFGLSDIGGGEIMLIGVIALLLFGKDLPVVMRTLGKHYSRIKNTLNDAKSEFTREMDSAAQELEEAKRELAEAKRNMAVEGLNERISFDDESPAPSTTPDLTTNNSPYTPPTQPPESIDQGPESLDKLSAAPTLSSTPAPTPAPAPVAETTAPVANLETPAAETAADAPKPSDAPTLDDLEKNLVRPKKIPPPIG